MGRRGSLLAILCAALSLSAHAQFIFQSSNNGSNVFTATKYMNLNWQTGCTATNSSGSLNINCSPTFGNLGSMVTGQVLFSTNNSQPSFASPSSVLGNSGAAVNSGGAYTALCDSATTLRDRGKIIVFQAGANTSPLIPDSTATGCSGMYFKIVNDGAGTLTFGRSGADTFRVCNGASCADSATSFTLANGQYALAYQSSALSWDVSPATNTLPESNLTGGAAVATLTETAAGNVVSRVGVETGNLTAPYVITNGNSSNNNTSVGAIIGATGTSTGGIGLLVFDVSGTGDMFDIYTGGSVAAGVYTPGTKEFSVTSAGQVSAVGAVTSSTSFQSNLTNTALKVQAGVDGNGTGATAALTVRGQSVTAGSTASIAGGALTLNGGDNGSSGATETGGAITVRGGDTTNASAAANTPGSVTIRGGNTSSTGASTASTVSITGGTISGAATNVAGGDVTIASGLGTGNATPSKVFIKDPAFVSASGTGAQSQVTRFVSHAKAGSTTTATATNMFQIPVAVNQTIGVEVVVHVETTQATPQNCSTTEEFFASVQNTSSTITSQSTAGTIGTICSTGTLTIAVAFSAATPSVFSVTPSWTTIAPSAVIITISVRNLSQQEITLL